MVTVITNRAFFTGVYIINRILHYACGYEFYLLVLNSISHSFAALTDEISSERSEGMR